MSSTIYITHYQNGIVNYMRDNIPSKMAITETMLKETFSQVEKTYPMILGLINEQLVIIIEKYHTIQNHISLEVDHRDLYLDYKIF